jgi:hypothetical protein
MPNCELRSLRFLLFNVSSEVACYGLLPAGCGRVSTKNL